MRVLIVGGVAGGASAAARLRRLDENAQIILFEKDPYISFANCGLPYFLGGIIEEESALLLQTPESFYGRFCVDVRVMSEVTKVDRRAKKVEVRKVDTGEIYWESYDKLILATGAAAVKPAYITGVDTEGVFTLRNVPDVMAIDRWIREKKPAHAIVAGGGYVGVEVAENLIHRGLKVTLVGHNPQIIKSVDAEMASLAQDEMTRHGVELKLGCGIQSIEKIAGGSLLVRTDTGDISTDMMVLSIGVVPSSGLARDAGLKLGIGNCISVNDKMQTSDPDIYAVGDVTESIELTTGSKQHLALAGPANRQGRIAADQIAGIDSRYKNAQASYIIKVFDLTVASTGTTEKMAKKYGLDVDKVYLYSNAHAGYYPGAKPLTCKILFDPKTGKLLGGQFVGEEGADKRADVMAIAIRAGMNAVDLVDQELCYAPPYNSAKDPLNMAGFAIENILTGKVKNFHWENVPTLDRTAVTLLDVRTVPEYEAGSVPGFVNIPLHELRSRLKELPQDKPVYVHCLSGMRSYVACRILTGHGFDCYNLSGGYFVYKTARKGKDL